MDSSFTSSSRLRPADFLHMKHLIDENLASLSEAPGYPCTTIVSKHLSQQCALQQVNITRECIGDVVYSFMHIGHGSSCFDSIWASRFLFSDLDTIPGICDGFWMIDIAFLKNN